MVGATKAKLVYPGEESWEVTDPREGGSRPLRDGETIPGATYAFAVGDLTALPVWLQGIDGAREMTLEMLAMQLERSGVEIAGSEEGEAPPDLAFWPVQEKGGRWLFATAALRPEGVGDAALAGGQFEISSRLYEIPEGYLAIWRELGRHVIAFKSGGEVVYQQVLASTGSVEDILAEIRCVSAQLKLSGAVPDLAGAVLFLGDEGEAAAEMIRSSLGIPVHVAPLPEPRRPECGSRLLPSEVVVHRRRRRRAGQALWLATALLALITGALATAGILNWMKSNTLQAGFAELRAGEAEVSGIVAAQERWAALAPAVDPDRYPLELLFQCTELLADGGVRLTLFDYDQPALTLVGEAATVGHAMRMRESLNTGNSPLARLRWDFPQPEILADGRATFRATGTLP